MAFCSTVGFICIRVLGLVKSHNMAPADYLQRVFPIGGCCACYAALRVLGGTDAARCAAAASCGRCGCWAAAGRRPAGLPGDARTTSRPPWLLHLCRRAVRGQPVALQLRLPLPLGLLHPNDQVTDARPGVRVRRGLGHRAVPGKPSGPAGGVLLGERRGCWQGIARQAGWGGALHPPVCPALHPWQPPRLRAVAPPTPAAVVIGGQHVADRVWGGGVRAGRGKPGLQGAGAAAGGPGV